MTDEMSHILKLISYLAQRYADRSNKASTHELLWRKTYALVALLILWVSLRMGSAINKKM
jgi:hypothetical protein